MLSTLHARVVRVRALRIFVMVVRVVLAVAFLPSGLVKIIGDPFTTLPVTDPVGRFFAGLFATGGYYRFIGIAQWVAGGLLLFPRTAALGALMYLPISINIFAITLAVGPPFRGTRVVTGAMVAANLFLVCWDWDRWQALVPNAPTARSRHGDAAITLGMFVGAGVAFAGVVGIHLARLRHTSFAVPLAMLLAGGLLGAAMIITAYRGTGSSSA